MGWDRRSSVVVAAPEPLVLWRWVMAAFVSLLAGTLLFVLYASGWVPELQALNAWAVSGSPLLIWILAFGARAYFYGEALSHHQFLEAESHAAQHAWQDWAQRYLAVHASCVLLPDQVGASVLALGSASLPPRAGQVRRIASLPAQKEERAKTGLQLILPGLESALQALPVQQELRVTLLSDVAPDQYGALRDAWRQNWTRLTRRPLPAALTLTDELSLRWIEAALQSPDSAFELIVVLQIHGGAAYSDGLAAMLLSPDWFACAQALPVQGCVSRPMPLDTDKVESELSLFLQTQTIALQATGLLADSADWQALMGKLMAVGNTQGASLKAEQQWIQASLCGLQGPFSSWLVVALGMEMARYQRTPLLVLAKDQSQRWISTVTPGERA